jgi:hypothetical protein
MFGALSILCLTGKALSVRHKEMGSKDMTKSKLAVTLAVIVALIQMTGCGTTVNQGQLNSNPTKSGQQTSGSQTQLLKINEIAGTKWKAKDGTEYEFTSQPSPMINDGEKAKFTSGFPKAIEKDHQTQVYALYQNSKPMAGNNGSGMWYAVTDYFPLDVEEYGGRWNYDASGALFLSLMSDNSGDHYSITATQNEMKLSVLDEGDGHFYYPFEPLQDDAQLNNGVGILERVS